MIQEKTPLNQSPSPKKKSNILINLRLILQRLTNLFRIRLDDSSPKNVTWGMQFV